MNYPADIASVTVTAGSATNAAGKSVACSYGASSAMCVVWGLNTTAISDGPVATAVFTISAASTSTNVPVTNSAASVSDAAGDSIPVSSSGGAITVIQPPPRLTIGCTPSGGPSLLGRFYSSQCTVTGGVPPYNWGVGAGALPVGLTLANQGTSAFVAGTPAVAGVYRYTILASDSSSPAPLTATLAYAGTIQSSNPTFNLTGSMPHLAAEGGWATTITLVNTGSDFAQTLFSLLDDNGNPLALPLTLPQQPATQSPVTAPLFGWTLASNASLIVQTGGAADAPVQVGSAQLAATGGIAGFSVFHFIPTVQEAAVPLETRNASSYLLAFDNTNGVVMGVALANITAQAVNVSLVIRDDTGVQIGSGSISLPGNGHTSFELASQFPFTANQRGTVEFDTAQSGQISVMGLRCTPPNNALTSIPALANVGTTGGSIAHVASGGDGWQSTFVLVNTGSSAAPATLNFFDDNGNPLLLPLSFPQSGGGTSTVASSLTQMLAPGATLLVQSGGSANLLTGSAQLSTTGNVSGFMIFRHNDQEATVPLESRNANAYVLAFDNTNGNETGVAMNSVSTQALNIPVMVRDDTGAQIATDTLILAPNGHAAFTLAVDKYPGTTNLRGTIEFDTVSGGQIGALAIRVSSANTLTSLPALTK